MAFVDLIPVLHQLNQVPFVVQNKGRSITLLLPPISIGHKFMVDSHFVVQNKGRSITLLLPPISIGHKLMVDSHCIFIITNVFRNVHPSLSRFIFVYLSEHFWQTISVPGIDNR
jgi:hypothetical protein